MRTVDVQMVVYAVIVLACWQLAVDMAAVRELIAEHGKAVGEMLTYYRNNLGG